MDATGATGARLVLAAPDSFKGSADAATVARAVAAAADAAGWRCDQCPLSDGGEGFAEVLAGLGGDVLRSSVTGPLGARVTATWRLAGRLAVVESAAASGLVLAGGAAGNDPVGATSRGTGELVAAALAAGARRVLVGVGGSATTDGGLAAVEAIEEAGGLGDAEVVVACDVATRFTDAAAVFGPQKGAAPDQVVELTARLRDLARRYRERYGVDVDRLRGGGAAGGLAGGLAALGARLRPGFDLVAHQLQLGSRLTQAQLVVTGEGQLDATSWSGKVVGGVARRARDLGVPVLVVTGRTGPGGVGRRPLRLLDLSARFGLSAAMAEPARCVTEAVRDELDSWPRSPQG